MLEQDSNTNFIKTIPNKNIITKQNKTKKKTKYLKDTKMMPPNALSLASNFSCVSSQ